MLRDGQKSVIMVRIVLRYSSEGLVACLVLRVTYPPFPVGVSDGMACRRGELARFAECLTAIFAAHPFGRAQPRRFASRC
jgi:hypothetical protein